MAKSQWIEPQLRALHDAVTAGENLKSLETLMHITALRTACFAHIRAEQADKALQRILELRVQRGAAGVYTIPLPSPKYDLGWWPRFEDLVTYMEIGDAHHRYYALCRNNSPAHSFASA